MQTALDAQPAASPELYGGGGLSHSAEQKVLAAAETHFHKMTSQLPSSTTYDLSGQWALRFASVLRPTVSNAFGWTAPSSVSPTFVEPSLIQRLEGDARVILVSAPGAVGKSMYANQMAAKFGLVLFDLAIAGPVGENTLVGSAFRALGSDGPARIKAGDVAIVIDALDEGQLKVTPEAYAAFLKDVAELAPEAGPPIVLFGRTAAIEEAWSIFTDIGFEPLVLEISLFDNSQSSQFVRGFLSHLGESNTVVRTHLTQYNDVAEALVSRLRDLTKQEPTPNAFAGYAPVLEAVCRAVADQNNPATFAQEVQGSVAVELLAHICERMLVREQGKLLSNLNFADRVDDNTLTTLYSPQEQRARLCERLFGTPLELDAFEVTPDVADEYQKGLEQFFPQHPFLDGTGRKAANAVFAADLSAMLLHYSDRSSTIFSNADVTRNPFLFDFYEILRRRAPDAPVPVSHAGLLYSSLSASSDIGQCPALMLTDGGDGEPAFVQIGLMDDDDGLLIKWIEGQPVGDLLTLPDTVSEIVVSSQQVAVEFGNGGLTVLESPIFISTPLLSIRGTDLFVRPRRRLSKTASPESLDVTIMAEEATISQAINSKRPNVAQPVNLTVAWPGSEKFPWTDFNAPARRFEIEEDVHRAYQLFRNLIVAFRSHSRGELKRYADKIENRRLTRNDLALAIRQQLMEDRILRLEGKFYALDATRLGELLDIDYVRIRKGESSQRCDDYLRQIVRALPDD